MVIPVIVLKSIVGLFLGLVLQLSQMQARGAAYSSESCPDTFAHLECCCEGARSCPCIDEGSPDQKPAPLAPHVVDLKLFISRTSEPRDFENLISLPKCDAATAVSRPESPLGYAGVPLSVAFCSFVI